MARAGLCAVGFGKAIKTNEEDGSILRSLAKSVDIVMKHRKNAEYR